MDTQYSSTLHHQAVRESGSPDKTTLYFQTPELSKKQRRVVHDRMAHARHPQQIFQMSVTAICSGLDNRRAAVEIVFEQF